MRYLGDNYPNPFSQTTSIPYYLPENSKGQINVFDIHGKLMGKYPLTTGYNTIEINTAEWINGVYLYNIEVDSSVRENKRMVLIK